MATQVVSKGCLRRYLGSFLSQPTWLVAAMPWSDWFRFAAAAFGSTSTDEKREAPRGPLDETPEPMGSLR